MTHRNARLTPVTRAELVEQVMDGWPQAEVARLFRVSRSTVSKWVRRFREGGADALHDRSSRPLRSPRQTARLQEATICAARRMLAWGPHRIGWKLGIARSTVYAVLRRAGLHRLAWLHRTTREIVRYEHPRPGALVHLDIKKLGRIPQGGGQAHPARVRRDSQWPSARPSPRVRLRPRSRGRPLPLCLRRGLAGRTRRERCCFPGPGACPLRTPRFHGRARPDRQRRLLREPHLHLYGGGTKPAVEAHAALPASDQWQGGGVQQDHAGRVGLPAAVLFQPRAARSAAWLPCVLQSPPSTRRHRRDHSRIPAVNNVPGNYT